MLKALGEHMNIHRRDRTNLRQKLMEDKKDDNVAGYKDVGNYISPGQNLGFWVQESNLDTNDDRLDQTTVERKDNIISK
ncbi:unnamed protein product [Eruca vesicaria subsp. sativa]|uniref:Uncharacterized protein n=1 Tax=Eruca vesicaria subsp. sativa TaxID=29727 RepID=A0ABC8M6J7_ERUVS|nr:unnamed protein product [Eruca vesicaria subsp. sativa]